MSTQRTQNERRGIIFCSNLSGDLDHSLTPPVNRGAGSRPALPQPRTRIGLPDSGYVSETTPHVSTAGRTRLHFDTYDSTRTLSTGQYFALQTKCESESPSRFEPNRPANQSFHHVLSER